MWGALGTSPTGNQGGLIKSHTHELTYLSFNTKKMGTTKSILPMNNNTRVGGSGIFKIAVKTLAQPDLQNRMIR